MRKIADIQICAACMIVVDSTPSMAGCRAQAECTRAGLAKNWPGYHIHGAVAETCDGSCYFMAPGSRFTLVVHRGLPLDGESPSGSGRVHAKQTGGCELVPIDPIGHAP